MSKEKVRELEGLILSWRIKIKNECMIKASNVEMGSAWHQYREEEYNQIIETYFKPLREFDEHFNIVTKRKGEI